MSAQLPEKVLIVDDDPTVAQGLMNQLKSHNIKSVIARNYQEGLYIFNQQRFDLCLVCLELDEMPGTVVVQRWRSSDVVSKRETPVVMLTAATVPPEKKALIEEMGRMKLISKPIKIPPLLSLMADALLARMRKEKLDEAYERGVEPAIRKKDFERAQVTAKGKLEPLGEEGQWLSVKAHLDSEGYEHAETLLKGLCQKYPNNMRYPNELGALYLKMNRNDDAKAMFEHADKMAPGNLERMESMAEMYLSLSMPDESVDKMRDLLKLSPDQPELKYSMYERLAAAGFEQHARSFCKETSTPRELVKHYNNKGVVYSKQEEYVDAIDEYKKALKLIPKSKEIHLILFNMALAHLKLKNTAHTMEAMAHLKKCLEINPKFEKAQEKLALIEKAIQKK
ncbi:MAG: response regulator [Zetaproteobacteria bacterium]|nr:response regulator [Zetaproteobacteria bacterium]